jgi:hypothetical protein
MFFLFGFYHYKFGVPYTSSRIAGSLIVLLVFCILTSVISETNDDLKINIYLYGGGILGALLGVILSIWTWFGLSVF